ncbi:hypothetical protein [Levilactobacillus fujinensis]|uniref:Uncharacterized protein n=1 Tax=Levilactobacillus fujinensis TaxID=2486024 RepID=A0ABW1TEC2_9LACO|nr:hypothetical protein [Levilactobacillus fujinensis]
MTKMMKFSLKLQRNGKGITLPFNTYRDGEGHVFTYFKNGEPAIVINQIAVKGALESAWN